MAFCTKCGTQLEDGVLACPNCQAETENKQALDAQHPMKWFKFLIYFALWFGAVINIISAISYMSGGQYAGQAGRVYAMYPAMRVVDIALGVFTLALGIFGIVVRFRLAKFRKNAPSMLITLYLLSLIPSLLYPVATTLVTGISTFDAQVISQMVGQVIGVVIVVICTKIYFKKRAYLFVN